MTKEEKLDVVLGYYKKDWELKNDSVKTAMHFIEFTSHFKPNEREFYEKHLLGECMLYPTGNKEYCLTHKGYFFEGFVNEKNRKEAELANLLNRNARAEQNEIKLVRWSRRATIAGYSAAAIAFLYLCWDIYKYYNQFHGGGETVIKQICIFL